MRDVPEPPRDAPAPGDMAKARSAKTKKPGHIARAAYAAYIWDMSTMCFKKTLPRPFGFATHSLSKRMVLPSKSFSA